MNLSIQTRLQKQLSLNDNSCYTLRHMYSLSDVDDTFRDAIVVDAVASAVPVDEELTPASPVVVAVAVAAAVAVVVPPSDV